MSRLSPAACLALSTLCLLPLAAAAAPPLRQGDNFMGWSKDGSFYVKVSLASETNFDAEVCASRAGAKIAWPKLFYNSTKGLCKQVNDKGSSLEDALATIVSARPSLTGPQGQRVSSKTIQLDEEHFETTVTITHKKRKIVLSDKPITERRPRVVSAAWLPDGSVVAVTLADNQDHRSVVVGEIPPEDAPAK